MFGAFKFAKSAGSRLLETKKGKDALTEQAKKYGYDTKGMDYDIDDDGAVVVRGKAASQEMKERILLAFGNVAGISTVKDEVEAEDGGAVSKFHEVVSGDTLGKISKQYYGKSSLYMRIFDANKPMLKNPDKIYVGQMLRIPTDEKSSTASV